MTCLPKLENLEGSAEGGSVRGTVEMVIDTPKFLVANYCIHSSLFRPAKPRSRAFD